MVAVWRYCSTVGFAPLLDTEAKLSMSPTFSRDDNFTAVESFPIESSEGLDGLRQQVFTMAMVTVGI